MANDSIYGGSYFGSPAISSPSGGQPSSYGIPLSSFSGGTSFSPIPNYGDTSASSAPSSGGNWSAGEKAAMGGLIGYGAMKLFGKGGGGTNINPDPYNLGPQYASEAKNLFDMYNKGELNPADEYRVAKWEQNQTQAAKDYYQKAGLANSSMAQEAAGNIKSQAQNMRNQYNQALLKPAMQAAGMANKIGQQIMQYQMYQDQQAQQAQQQLFQTIGTVAGAFMGM